MPHRAGSHHEQGGGVHELQAAGVQDLPPVRQRRKRLDLHRLPQANVSLASHVHTIVQCISNTFIILRTSLNLSALLETTNMIGLLS